MDDKTEKHTAVDKALILLKQVGALSARQEVRIKDLVEITGYQRPTVHRLLTTLKEHGFVEKIDSQYRLGGKIMALSAEAYGNTDVREISRPFMQSMSEKTLLTIHLAMVDDDEVVYIDKIESRQTVVLASSIGWRGALHSTSLGKAMMAYGSEKMFEAAVTAGLSRKTEFTITSQAGLKKEFEKIRNQGYAVDEQENETGIRCVAASILNHTGEPVAGISVSGTIDQVTPDMVEHLGALLTDASTKISAQLGYVKRN